MQGFNASLLAKMLRNYGISSSRTVTVRGYKRSDFYDAWNRYAPLEAVTPVMPVSSNYLNDAHDTHDANQRVSQ